MAAAATASAGELKGKEGPPVGVRPKLGLADTPAKCAR